MDIIKDFVFSFFSNLSVDPRETMVEERVRGFLDEAEAALEQGDVGRGKMATLKAILVITEEKEKFLTGLPGTATQQQLADWFGLCALRLSQAGDWLGSARYFYTATVFDANWTQQMHAGTAGTLWNNLVFNKELHPLNDAAYFTEIQSFLSDVDRIAKMAERQKKWNVCLTIDNDINTIFMFMKRKYNIGPANIIENGCRKEAPRRNARCMLGLGLYQEVKKLCSIILQEFSDYDDVEAMELWARALYKTEDYTPALSRCDLALQHARDIEERQRLGKLKDEIEDKLEAMQVSEPELMEEWLPDNIRAATNKGDSKRGQSGSPDSSSRSGRKKKRRRPKARSPSLATPRVLTPSQVVLPPRRRQVATPEPVSKVNGRAAPNQTVRKLQMEAGDAGRLRTFSGDSSISDVSYECSLSSSDSDDDQTELESMACSSVADVMEVCDEEEEIEEQTTLYQQSCSFHQQTDLSDATQMSVTNERLLRNGIRLNMSYLSRFEDRHPDIMDRPMFYSEFLPDHELRAKLIGNPKKYIRCTLQIEGSHDAYCTPIDANLGYSKIEISGRSKCGHAFNEDEVVVEILDDKVVNDKRYGKVIGVLNRHRHNGVKHPVFICTLDDMDGNLVRPMCRTIPKIHILDNEIRKKYKYKNRRFKVQVQDYDEFTEELCNVSIKEVNPSADTAYVYLVAYISWGHRHIYPRGAVIKVLACGDSIPRGLSILNLQYQVPMLYAKATVDRVECMLTRGIDEPEPHALKGRLDLTQLNTFTIDPQGSRDLDDALSIERYEEGYKIGVHIADVSYYVKKGDPVDEEARGRATTFYPGIRRPRNMLPEPLSANTCSLLPNKKRLTISVFFYVTAKGMPMQMQGPAYEIRESYIESKRQFTYAQAQEVINAGKHQDQMSTDVCLLFKIARQIRERRLGKSMFAMDVDWEENLEDETTLETAEAHYLVEEYMIMANKRVAEVLVKKYPCVPIRCQPPPSQEGLDEFVKKNDKYVDTLVRMQDKEIAGVKRGVDHALAQHKSSNAEVIVSKETWEIMSESVENAVACLQRDDLFPLQHVVYQHWLSLQDTASYKCSGSAGGRAGGGAHFSLGFYPYTHFTSPIRRYNDLVVHRLLRALIHDANCPYLKAEVDSICVHMNSQMKKSKEYQNGCKSLVQGLALHDKPKMISCYVDEVTDRGVSLCSPLLKHTRKQNRELSFPLLDMGFKPELTEDKTKQCSIVKAKWRRRVYDHKGKPPSFLPDNCNGAELTLNANKNVLFIPIVEWARLLRAATERRFDDMKGMLKRIQPRDQGYGHEDVSTECLVLELLQPSTKFSMTYSRGQTLTVQMSAAPFKGMMVPKPMLYKMTPNVNFCLQHTDDPVLHLFRYVTRPTCDEYKNEKQYLERWLPIMLMEAATGIVKNEESCSINNVPIKFDRTSNRKGRFALSLAHCETRNIELSGTQDDEEDETAAAAAADDGDNQAYDWLCLKCQIPNSDKGQHGQSLQKNLHQTHPDYYVAHAYVRKVSKKKVEGGEGKITVTFELHEKAAPVPYDVLHSPTDVKWCVEILRKSEVDRRTETYIKQLPTTGSDSLAVKIALKKTITRAEGDYAHHVSLMTQKEKDVYFNASSDDPKRRPLPPNNAKQQEAINKALRSRFTLIQGPPGTGKTYTGIKLIYLFNKINGILAKEGKGKKQVLFCGPSNKSVDLVAKWMYNRMGNYTPKFVRVYGRSIEALDFPIPGRTFLSKKSTRNQLADHELKEVALHHLIRKKGKKHAEEITALDAKFKANGYKPDPKVSHYVHLIRQASIDEIRKHDVILCTTAVGSNPKVLEATSVYQVIVDEAGMCPEPQCLVPIIATKAEQVVLIGDHKQLRPIIMCKEAARLGLEVSLFERYALTTSTVEFTMLDQQYRMDPKICHFPSRTFYEGKLTTMPGAWCNDKLRIWPMTQWGPCPHVLVHIEGEEKVLSVSSEDGNEHSKSNAEEIEYVMTVYKFLLSQAPNADVVILSQYNAQCSEIKRKLDAAGYSDPDLVRTVVSSQGGEWDYVIFSTVRSLPDYKIERNPTLGWCKHNLGFITDQNQVNVALTRARKGLIIVGNEKLLSCDEVWGKLVQEYRGNGCLMTPETFPPKIQAKSRMAKMEQEKERTMRRHGQTIYQKGQATSYDGSFDDDNTSGWRQQRRPRRN